MNEKDMSRRDFLKIVGISTATATAATLAGCGPKGAGNNETGAGTVPVGKMDYRTNPKTGERVSLLGYGCMLAHPACPGEGGQRHRPGRRERTD